MSQRWERETPRRLARSSSVCSSVSRMERTKAPKVSGPPRSFSRYFTAALFFSLAILTSSVVVLVDFLDRNELDCPARAHYVDRPVRAAEPDGSLALSVSLERLVMEPGYLAH